MRFIASALVASLAFATLGVQAQAVRSERNISLGLASQIATEAVNACAATA
jgi:hypothetical protein